MATRFEIVLHGEDPVSLRAAGEEALEEIARLENQLSLYRPNTEIAHLNARAAAEPVRVSPAVFSLLARAQKLSQESGGAFDITIAPLVRCWGFMGGIGQMPRPGELAEARAKVGMGLVLLDSENFTVRFCREGVMLDLGAIGKGYAIERAAELLREAGVTSALLHGGTSTVYAIGHPPDADSWKVAVEHPQNRPGFQPISNPTRHFAHLSSLTNLTQGDIPMVAQQGAPQETCPAPLATVSLKDQAMSVSAVWGRSFDAEGKTYGHVLDPRTGEPVNCAVLAAVVLPSATETDALSTALLVLGSEGHEAIAQLRPSMGTLLVVESGGQLRIEAHGMAGKTGVME